MKDRLFTTLIVAALTGAFAIYVTVELRKLFAGILP